MGFNINPTNKPIIREAANMQNDGGAGNTGYFEQEGGEKKKKNSALESVFNAETTDTFVKEGSELEEDDEFKLGHFFEKITLFFKKLFKN